MSLYGTMRTGVSGMNAQANRLSTVADNIANANTTGYKKASTVFSSMILPTTNGYYNSGGVMTDVRYSISAQGNFTYSTSPTDLAIKGKGFFIVTGTDGVEYLTRAGSFTVMGDGTMKNAAGFTLMGYPYSTMDDPTIVINGFAGLEKINLAAGELGVKASEKGYLHVNLPSNEAHPYSKATSLVAYDSQGNTRKLEFTYSTTATANEWELRVTYLDPESGDLYDMMTGAVIGSGDIADATPEALSFDTDGKLAAGATDINLSALPIDGAELKALTISVGGATGGSTQLAASFAAKGDIDGIGPSEVSSYEIGEDGIVYIKYMNGDTAPKFRIAMADVLSPDNLRPLPNNVYSQGVESGVIIMGYAGNNGYGTIVSGALEDSNVDIGEELTNMIESQRNYTANSKVFQTGSELMEVLVNLKR